MEIIKGFPSTMQDDYQLNLINMIKHGARNFEKQQIVWKQGDEMFRYTYADAYNRIKRLVREAFRANRHTIDPPVDIVVVAKRGADKLKQEEVTNEILRALSRWHA